MVAVFVVFTSTVEFRISAVYMGGVPLAEHDSMPPCIANRAAGNVTIGGTNQLEIKIFYPLCSFTDPYLFTLISYKSNLAEIEFTDYIVILQIPRDAATEVFYYLLRGCSIMELSIIKRIIGEGKETTVMGKVQLPCLIDACIWASFSATS